MLVSTGYQGGLVSLIKQICEEQFEVHSHFRVKIDLN
jgi:hypothetical protein